jgi:hypothetical protein
MVIGIIERVGREDRSIGEGIDEDDRDHDDQGESESIFEPRRFNLHHPMTRIDPRNRSRPVATGVSAPKSPLYKKSPL